MCPYRWFTAADETNRKKRINARYAHAHTLYTDKTNRVNKRQYRRKIIYD